ncbi:MAG: hypothetical protein ACHQHN_06120 [Sphingobacteriales bacterium]
MKTKLMLSQKIFLLILLVVCSSSAFGQAKTYTRFPVLADGLKTYWKEYDKAKNVKVVNGTTFSFDLMGDHYRVQAYPNGVKTIKKAVSELTKNKNDKDSVTDVKLFLLPASHLDDKVIDIQVNYVYEEGSTRLKGYSMIPLMFFRDIEEARKQLKLPAP